MTDYADLVKRLQICVTGLLRADGDRDLGFQSNITTTASMALVDELRNAADAIEALVKEVRSLNAECQRLEDGQFARAEAAEQRSCDLEAQLARLKEALTKIGECDHERVTKEVYRTDGAHSKMDKCDHGRRMFEDCDECTASFARRALEE